MTGTRFRRNGGFFQAGLLLVAISRGAAAAETSQEIPQHPNVVFVLTDDQRWNTIGIAPDSVMKTPNIDRLAREGVYFRNAFCTTSLCSPSRASILGGLYAHAHGVQNNFTEYPENLQTFPLVLQHSGYQTAYIGKYHMGEENDEKRPGYDYFATHKGQGQYFGTVFRINNGQPRAYSGYYTHTVTQLALDWLKQRDKNRPFMLFVGHKAPHSFYTPEPKYAHSFDEVDARYPRSAFYLDGQPDWFRLRLDTWHGIYGPIFDYRKQFPDRSAAGVVDFSRMVQAYRGTIQSVDDSVGELYRFLADEKEIDRTIFIYTGDNGLLEGEHGMVDKRTMHEPSIRVPLVVRYPGLTPPTQPKVIQEQVLTLDFAPSILDLCHAPPLKKTHGRSWKQLVQTGDPEWRTIWMYEYNYEKQFPYTPNIRGVRTSRWKYIRYPHGDGSPDHHMGELYEISSDPEESRNLIHDPHYAPVVDRLRGELDRLMKETGPGADAMPLDEGIKSALPDKKIR